ncbi:MAG: rRNA maturation RNase YbeY [Bdellovibrionota bacterium]|mgnify:CR=1 FL=1
MSDIMHFDMMSNKWPQWEAIADSRLKSLIRKARSFKTLAKHGPVEGWKVSVAIVGSAVIKKLNTVYRGKMAETDVLSFPAHGIFRQSGYLGDIIICLPVLKRQAKLLGHAATDELDVLLVHGLLHLLGLDHVKGLAGARTMAGWEERILNKRGRRSARTAAGLIKQAYSGKRG